MKPVEFTTHVSYDGSDGLYRVEFEFPNGDSHIEYGEILDPLLAKSSDVFRWMDN